MWDEAISRFEQAHPSIRVMREIATHSSTAYHGLLSQRLKNRAQSLDLYFMDVIWPSEFAAAEWVFPIDDRLSPSEHKKFLQATIQARSPMGVSGLAMLHPLPNTSLQPTTIPPVLH